MGKICLGNAPDSEAHLRGNPGAIPCQSDVFKYQACHLGTRGFVRWVAERVGLTQRESFQLGCSVEFPSQARKHSRRPSR